MRVELSGIEAATIELAASIAEADARALLLSSRLAPAMREDGRVEASLLVIEMRGLGLSSLPGPRFDYREALWRMGVMHEGARAWLGLRCDLDRALIRGTGALLIRYPVRRAEIDIEHEGERWSTAVTAGGASFEARLDLDAESPSPEPPRALLVEHSGHLYRVPWREDPAPFRRRADAAVTGDLGTQTFARSLLWDRAALVHRGRVHRCGFAQRISSR